MPRSLPFNPSDGHGLNLRRVSYTIAACLVPWSIVGLAGCSTAEPPATVAAPAEPEPEPELSWDDQLAAVKAGRASEIHLTSAITPEQWSQLGEGCEGLVVLKLPQARLEDEQLPLLASLVSLRQLVLGSPVGDAGLEAIAACPSLEILNLPRAQFTDAGLERLRQLPLLTLLRFGSPHVTNAGMEHLPEMSNLRFVHLLDVPITDDGLEPLKRCKLLESFYLDGSRCTEEGLGCLLKAHKGLHLHVNQLHLPGDGHDHQH